MTDSEIEEQIAVVKFVIQESTKKFIGEPMTEEVVLRVKNEIRLVLAHADMTFRSHVTDLVDVIVEIDPENPKALICSFKRK